MLLRHNDSSPMFGLSQLLFGVLEDSFTYQVETQSVHIKAPARRSGKSCVTPSQDASGLGAAPCCKAPGASGTPAVSLKEVSRTLAACSGVRPRARGWGGSFQDVGLKRDQVVVGEVGDVRRRILVALLRLQGQKVTSILVSGTKTGEKEELAGFYTRRLMK